MEEHRRLRDLGVRPHVQGERQPRHGSRARLDALGLGRRHRWRTHRGRAAARQLGDAARPSRSARAQRLPRGARRVVRAAMGPFSEASRQRVSAGRAHGPQARLEPAIDEKTGRRGLRGRSALFCFDDPRGEAV